MTLQYYGKVMKSDICLLIECKNIKKNIHLFLIGITFSLVS